MTTVKSFLLTMTLGLSMMATAEGTCADSTTFFVDGNTNRGCSWVADKASRRCVEIDADPDHEIPIYCPITCDTCPTDSPTTGPTTSPTDAPIGSPSESPTLNPTNSPTLNPTDSPTNSPTNSPTLNPTDSPTNSPTDSPTNSPTDSPTPSPTDSRLICDPVTHMECGDEACVAVKGDGRAFTWGDGHSGGNSSSADLTDVVEATCGGYACGAIKSDGTAEFWGDPDYGGDASSADLTDIAGIGCTEYGYGCWAWKTDGTGYTWGNSYTNNTHDNPRDDKPELIDIEDLVCGEYDCIGLKTDGTAVAWGYYWDDLPTSPHFQKANYTTNVSKIGCGHYTCWIIKTDGTAIAFGEYEYGTVDEVDLHTDVEDFSMHGYEGAALYTDGTVVFTGYYTVGSNTTDAVKVSCGGSVCAVLKTDGTVEGFGYEDYLANITKVGGNVTDISCGGYACVALKSDGTVVGFGSSFYGAEIPKGLTDVAEVNCGIWRSGCTAIKTDGTGVAWGYYGEIGRINYYGGTDYCTEYGYGCVVGDPDEIDLVNPNPDCVPTGSPTVTHAPTACFDSDSFYFGDIPRRTCEWAAKNPSRRCNRPIDDTYEVKANCRVTCGTCSTTQSCSDSATFYLGNKPHRNCRWASGNPVRRCNKPTDKNLEVQTNCPLACDTPCPEA